ncbi:class I SAM-dependent methyltransferase [Streptomyces sp. NPDC058548]|uniref:class I SAM-dependent methyltransferase n=1 Tax=Streptomyces sp. NPDC058548 TaxID=3346545 RepID=UPI0036678208
MTVLGTDGDTTPRIENVDIPGVLPRTGLAALLGGLDLPGRIEMPDGSVVRTGVGEPTYRVSFRSERALRTPMTESAVARAYVSGDIDIDGDLRALFDARKMLRNSVPFRQKLRFLYDFLRPAGKMNASAIEKHYSKGDDFYLTFIDKRFRFYSQGLFQSPDETIEEASEHKLETMFAALDLKPGDRLLDIGGGWGGVTQYCGARGVHVTTLTLAEDSARFIGNLIADNDLPGEVTLQDFLDHQPEEPYDHVVIYGVIEHIPNYRAFAENAWRVLKPGGRLYLDASASIQKFAMSAVARDYIWTGTHTFMSLPDVTGELLNHGFEVVEVSRETRDYGLTMLEWASRMEAAKDDVIAQWGEETYRIFRLYLWGGAHAFFTNSLQAYHVVAERTDGPGPRPSVARRLIQSLAALR